jgi:hypothetical protein
MERAAIARFTGLVDPWPVDLEGLDPATPVLPELEDRDDEAGWLDFGDDAE